MRRKRFCIRHPVEGKGVVERRPATKAQRPLLDVRGLVTLSNIPLGRGVPGGPVDTILLCTSNLFDDTGFLRESLVQ